MTRPTVTAAQKRALLWLPSNGDSRLFLDAVQTKDMQALADKGLVVKVRTYAFLTPAGIAARREVEGG